MLADELHPFSDYAVYDKYRPLEETLGHPVGKFAKLFFALEYLERHVNKDVTVLFLDPDTLVQHELAHFVGYANLGPLLFGYEMQSVHVANRPNARLCVAESFEDRGPWAATYFKEINTGVVLGRGGVFREVIGDFRRFVDESPYIEQGCATAGANRWHDQDFMRFFLRRTLPDKVAVLELDEIYTTVQAAACCVHYDPGSGQYVTRWGKNPHIMHFAGRTQRFAKARNVAWDVRRRRFWILKKEDSGVPLPAKYAGRGQPPLLSRLYDKSPRDYVEFVRSQWRRFRKRLVLKKKMR